MTSKQLEGVLEGYSEIIENYTAYYSVLKERQLLATTTLSFGSNSNNVKERGKVEEAPFNVS